MLAPIIALLSAMSYAELKDFIDYCEFYELAQLAKISECYTFRKNVKLRRAGLKKDPKTSLGGGLPLIEFPDGNILPSLDENLLTMVTEGQTQALEIIEGLKGEKKAELLIQLFGEATLHRNTGGAIAWALLREKAPVRRESMGNIEVKKIGYKQPIYDEEGKPTGEYRIIEGKYLYLRYWAVQGDTDRKTRRHKSLYIGGDTMGLQRKRGGYPYKALAELFESKIQAHGVERPRKDPKTGEEITYKARPKGNDNPIAELEKQILACIDLSQDMPVIDHNALLELQSLLFNIDTQE